MFSSHLPWPPETVVELVAGGEYDQGKERDRCCHKIVVNEQTLPGKMSVFRSAKKAPRSNAGLTVSVRCVYMLQCLYEID